MRLRRRGFLALPVLLGSSAAGAAPVLPGAPPAPDLDHWKTTIEALVDTLLPADGDSPAASALGVHARMVLDAARQPAYAQLMHEGCNWLRKAAEARGGGSFHALSVQQRVEVLQAAETAEAGSLPARFFPIVHRHAVELFYSHKESWPDLGYAGPPQPVGFPDHAEPPAAGA